MLFARWQDAVPDSTRVRSVPEVDAYEPGLFFRRELPCLLAVLSGLTFDLVVVDGYAWLGPGRPGLGVHLHQALDVPVIGVAKTRFANSGAAPLLRGTGATPLYVSAAGLALEEAVAAVRSMHGPYRLPTLLKQVDRLCRDAP